MQKFTTTEIRWLIGILGKECRNMKDEVCGEFKEGMFHELAKLRHDNLEDMINKFESAIQSGDKIIKITA